jgi:hypothetical protein
MSLHDVDLIIFAILSSVMFRFRNAGHNRNVMIANKYLETLTKFRCLVTTITAKCIHKEIKNVLIQGMFATFQLRIFCFPVSFLKT